MVKITFLVFLRGDFLLDIYVEVILKPGSEEYFKLKLLNILIEM